MFRACGTSCARENSKIESSSGDTMRLKPRTGIQSTCNSNLSVSEAWANAEEGEYGPTLLPLKTGPMDRDGEMLVHYQITSSPLLSLTAMLAVVNCIICMERKKRD